MRHGRKVKKLGRKWAHRKALVKNLLAALFTHERIRTTIAKAKETKRFADRLITFAKENTLAARRRVRRYITDEGLVRKLFNEIAPRLFDRSSGYTRIFRLGPRKGDAAEMAILELVARSTQKTKKEAKIKKPKEAKLKEEKKEKTKKAPRTKKTETAPIKSNTDK